MAELDPFQLLPEPFPGVQLGGRGRQALQVEARRRASREQLLDGLAAVDRRAIPDEPHPAGHLAQQGLKKPDHVVGVDGVVLAMAGELARGGDGTDGREMVTRAPLPQHRRLAHRRTGADDTRQGIKVRFVSEEDRLGWGLCAFLIAAPVSVRQRAMAASSRRRARRAGCCGLHRRA